MPKGGSKGGTRFPRISLSAALECSQKLVGKTHNSPQPSSLILPGVFGSSTTAGKVKASALIQYGLMEGETSAYTATKLAREIVAVPAGEKSPLLVRALQNAKVFKQLYETFQNDSVTRAKLRQQALALKVHLDSADECVDIFVKSVVAAGLAKEESDSITLFASPKKAEISNSPNDEDNDSGEDEDGDDGESDAADDLSRDEESSSFVGTDEKQIKKPGRAAVTVSLTVDSSLDTDKLKKQLALLRQFGVI